MLFRSLVSGPVKPLADIEHGMDGTIKHFVTFAGSRERVCDYIQDRYGNSTNLVYVIFRPIMYQAFSPRVFHPFSPRLYQTAEDFCSNALLANRVDLARLPTKRRRNARQEIAHRGHPHPTAADTQQSQ